VSAKTTFLCILFIIGNAVLFPALAEKPLEPEQFWGVGMVKRTSNMPYVHALGVVKDVVPQMYYEGRYLYLRGSYGGIRFFELNDFSFSIMGRFRFFDIPEKYQNEYQGSDVDAGLQFEYEMANNIPYQLELMSDSKGNAYLNNHLRYHLDFGDFDFDARATVRLKSAEFNNRYYGLDWLQDPNTGESIGDDIGSDYDVTVGSKARYHAWSNLYLLAEANLTRFGNNTYHSDVIDSSTQADFYLGFGFFNDKKRKDRPLLPDKHYLRLAYGWATPSNIGEIIAYEVEKDPQNNALTSIFYGMPVGDTALGLPISTYITPGFIYHYISDDYTNTETGDVLSGQEISTEYVLAIKFYLTVDWPTQWRLGFAEGLSYASSITNVEQVEFDEKEYETSKLMNYLDFSLDVSVGDLINYRALDKLWLGYSMHHRSGIFETSSSFGRVKGGSNYNNVYLQWHW